VIYMFRKIKVYAAFFVCRNAALVRLRVFMTTENDKNILIEVVRSMESFYGTSVSKSNNVSNERNYAFSISFR
jgi:hypothetical protein